MTQIWKLAAVVLSGLLAGCADRVEQQIGSGPVILSPAMQSAFEAYLAYDIPLVFMVTADGSEGGASACAGLECRPTQVKYRMAYDICQKRSGGQPCYIYAIGSRVVWKHERAKTKSAQDSKFFAGFRNDPFQDNPDARMAYHDYIRNQDQGVFVINRSGSAWAWRDCHTRYCWSAKTMDQALNLCDIKSEGDPCKVYAVRLKIVWRDVP